MLTPLVRGGVDAFLNKEEGGHGLVRVYGEMLLQILHDYPGGLPNARTLTMTEIRFFYDGIRPDLYEGTRPKPTPKLR